MGWLKDILDEFGKLIHKIDSFLGGAWSSLAQTAGFRYFTKAGLELRWKTMSEKERGHPATKAAYEAAKKEIEEGGMFAGLPEALLKGFDGLKDTIQGSMADLLKTSLQPGSPEVTKAIEGVMDTLLDSFLNIMDPDGDKISKELRKGFTDTMTPMMNLGLTFTVGTVLAELIHPTKELGMGRISHFIYDTVGFKQLMDAYIEPIRTNLVKQPTKYSINELTTPFIPRWGDAVEWFGRGHIDEEEMLGLMKKHGIVTDYAWLYGRMGTKPSSYFMLNAIGKEGLYNEDDFKFWLSDAGYGAFQITQDNMSTYEKKYGLSPPSTTQIDFLAQSYRRMGERVDWQGMIPLAKAACRDGLRDISFFKEQLKRSYRKEEVNALEVELLEGDIKEQTDKEYRKAYEKKFLSGRMELDELKVKLGEYGLTPIRVKARAEYLVTRKLGKLVVDEDEKMLSDAKIINSYRYGLKEKMWAIKGLDDKGYSLEDSELMVAAVEQKSRDDVNKEWFRVYEQRMKFNVITVEDLENAYIGRGKTPGWAEARATYVLEKSIGAPEAITEADTEKIKANITKEWMHVYEQRAVYGEITREALVSGYVELGKDPEWASIRATYIFERIDEKLMGIEEKAVERAKKVEAVEAERELAAEAVEAERELAAEAAEAEREKAKLVTEWIRMVEQRAMYGLLSDFELVTEYIALGKDAEWAETRATYIFEKLEEKRVATEAAEAEKERRLGEAEAKKVIAAEAAEAEREKAKLATEWIRGLEQRAVYELITKDELVIGYMGLGKDAEWAEARATYIFEKLEEKRVATEAAEAERMKKAEAAEAEKIEADTVKEWVRVIEQRAKYGLITQGALEKEYVALGKDREWAKTRTTYIFERIEEHKKLLDIAKAEKIARLGIAEAEKEIAAEAAEAEKIKANIVKEWVRVIEQRAKYGLITQGALEKEYVALGKDREWAKNRAIYIFEKIEGKSREEEE